MLRKKPGAGGEALGIDAKRHFDVEAPGLADHADDRRLESPASRVNRGHQRRKYPSHL